MPSVHPSRIRLISELGLVYAAAVWGSTFVLVKQATADVDPIVLVGYRSLLAAALMALWVALLPRGEKVAAADQTRAGLFAGAALAIMYIPQTIGLAFTSASNSAFITGLFVVFVPLFGRLFFRLRPAMKDLVAVVLAVLGLGILTGGVHNVNRGDLMTLVTAAAYGLHVLLTDRFVKRGIESFRLCRDQFAVTGALSLLLALALGLPLEVRTASAGYAIAFLAVFPTVTAFLIQTVAQKHTAPVRVALIFSLEPVFAALFAWTWGGEPFLWHSALGGLLIVSAMVVSALPKGSSGSGEPERHPPLA